MGKKKDKLINGIKWFGLIIKLIFWVSIIILSFGFAFIVFAGSDLEEELFYKDEYINASWL